MKRERESSEQLLGDKKKIKKCNVIDEQNDSILFTKLTSDCLNNIIKILFTHTPFIDCDDDSNKLDLKNNNFQMNNNDPFFYEKTNKKIYIYLFVLKFTCKKFHNMVHQYMSKHYESFSIPIDISNNFVLSDFEPIVSNRICPIWILLRFVKRKERNLIDWFINLDLLPMVDNETHSDDSVDSETIDYLRLWPNVWRYEARNGGSIEFLKLCSDLYPNDCYTYDVISEAAMKNNMILFQWAFDNIDQKNIDMLNENGYDSVLIPAIEHGNIEMIEQLVTSIEYDNYYPGGVFVYTKHMDHGATLFMYFGKKGLIDLYKLIVYNNHIHVLEWMKEKGLFKYYPSIWSNEIEGECIKKILEDNNKEQETLISLEMRHYLLSK